MTTVRNICQNWYKDFKLSSLLGVISYRTEHGVRMTSETVTVVVICYFCGYLLLWWLSCYCGDYPVSVVTTLLLW